MMTMITLQEKQMSIVCILLQLVSSRVFPISYRYELNKN